VCHEQQVATALAGGRIDDVSPDSGDHLQPGADPYRHCVSGERGQASQTLSVYFLAFAAGVVCWGRLCDLIGGAAMLAGLLNRAPHRWRCWPLNLKPCCWPGHRGLGAAVGSVVTQTMLRDSYQGSDLARVFSVMGIALS
jgi:MFS family permease